MLKQRIITALLLIPPLLVAFFWLPSTVVAALLGVFVGAGAWEWAALCSWTRTKQLVFLLSVVLIGGTLLALAFRDVRVGYAVLALAALWWFAVPFELARRTGGVLRSARGRAIAGWLTLVPAWLALGLLHAVDADRPLLLLYTIALVAFADTAAYAAGYAFGRTKLAPAISPGKTLEGVGGGMVAVLLLAYVCGTMIWHLEGSTLVWWIMLAVVTGLVSVVGDLTESKMKRLAGVKDSGTLLPGHGGVLDRIDALTAAAPVFALGALALFGLRA